MLLDLIKNCSLCCSKEFPFDNDARTVEEKIMDDIKYFIHRHSYEDNPYFDYEKDMCEFPVEDIFPFIHEANDVDELRAVISKEFVINENDCLVYKLPISESDSDDNYEDENEAENDPKEETSALGTEEDDWN